MSSRPLRRLAPLLRVSLLLAATGTLLPAQTASAPAPDAATLARYDTNRNRRLDPAEQTALDGDRARAVAAGAAAANTPRPSVAGAVASDETVVLSPFEVVADTKGYFAANTMEEMADFALLAFSVVEARLVKCSNGVLK